MTRASGRQAARVSAHRHAAHPRATDVTDRAGIGPQATGIARQRPAQPPVMGMPHRPYWHLASQAQEATMPSMPVPDSPVMDPIEVSVPSLLTENSSTAPAPPVST